MCFLFWSASLSLMLLHWYLSILYKLCCQVTSPTKSSLYSLDLPQGCQWHFNRFRCGFPTKNVIILVVTIASLVWGVYPIYIVQNIGFNCWGRFQCCSFFFGNRHNTRLEFGDRHISVLCFTNTSCLLFRDASKTRQMQENIEEKLALALQDLARRCHWFWSAVFEKLASMGENWITDGMVHGFSWGLSLLKCCIFWIYLIYLIRFCVHIFSFCLKSTTLQDLENDQFSKPTQFCGDIAREWTGLAKSVAGSLKESTAGNILGTLKSIPHRKSTAMISWLFNQPPPNVPPRK